jgi:hypothetical protein
MIFEWRTYGFAPGGAATYLEVFQREGLPIVTRHLPLLGYWLTECGRLNVLHHLWAYADLDDRAARRARLAADSEWSGGFGPRAFPMIERQETMLLQLGQGSQRLSEALAAAREPQPAVAEGSPLLADSWALLEIADAAPAGPAGSETTALWQVLAGSRPASHVGLFRSSSTAGILPTAGSAQLRELLRPAVFSPLR